MAQTQVLSKNQKIILDIIEKSNQPLKAYSILFSVQKKGIKAPPQVYRALDRLIKLGKIHKIESKNAFVACKNDSCTISNATAFSIISKTICWFFERKSIFCVISYFIKFTLSFQLFEFSYIKHRKNKQN